MKKGIIYLFTLFITSFIICGVVEKLMNGNNYPDIVFLLSIIVASIVLDKNKWFIEIFEEMFAKSTGDKN